MHDVWYGRGQIWAAVQTVPQQNWLRSCSYLRIWRRATQMLDVISNGACCSSVAIGVPQVMSAWRWQCALALHSGHATRLPNLLHANHALGFECFRACTRRPYARANVCSLLVCHFCSFCTQLTLLQPLTGHACRSPAFRARGSGVMLGTVSIKIDCVGVDIADVGCVGVRVVCATRLRRGDCSCLPPTTE